MIPRDPTAREDRRRPRPAAVLARRVVGIRRACPRMDAGSLARGWGGGCPTCAQVSTRVDVSGAAASRVTERGLPPALPWLVQSGRSFRPGSGDTRPRCERYSAYGRRRRSHLVQLGSVDHVRGDARLLREQACHVQDGPPRPAVQGAPTTGSARCGNGRPGACQGVADPGVRPPRGTSTCGCLRGLCVVGYRGQGDTRGLEFARGAARRGLGDRMPAEACLLKQRR